MVGPRTDAYTRVIERSTPGLNGCLEFHHSPLPAGYGRISDNGKPRRASRVVMEHHFGPSPLMVLHSCDNPPCVNVDHLRYGTHQENVADAVSRGRMGRKSTLSPTKVRLIRRSTEPHHVIGAKFGISPSYVGMIRQGKRRAAA